MVCSLGLLFFQQDPVYLKGSGKRLALVCEFYLDVVHIFFKPSFSWSLAFLALGGCNHTLPSLSDFAGQGKVSLWTNYSRILS